MCAVFLIKQIIVKSLLSVIKSMKVIATIALYIWYLYVVINMIIDIKDFGDFIWFIFVGSILMAILQFIIGVVLVAIWGNE